MEVQIFGTRKSPDTRKALRFFADRSLDEIATLTGRPLGTVKTHLRRGLLRLRDSLAGGAP